MDAIQALAIASNPNARLARTNKIHRELAKLRRNGELYDGLLPEELARIEALTLDLVAIRRAFAGWEKAVGAPSWAK